MRRRGGKKRGSKGRWWDRKYRVWTTLCVASRMLLLHMQEIVFVDSQEGLLSSRGGGGADILAPGLHPCSLWRVRTYGFGTNWRWVINDRIFGLTNPLRQENYSWYLDLFLFYVFYGVAPSYTRNNAIMLTHFHFYGISHNAKMVLLCATLLLMTSELFLTAEIRLILYHSNVWGQW